MRQKILFDVDYTLIDTAKFKENFKRKITGLLDISFEDFLLAEQDYVKKDCGFTDFVPQDYIDFISDKFNFDKLMIAEAFFNDENFSNIVFPDVYPSLEILSKMYDLGIFSEGFKEFQLLKLRKTGLFDFFDENLIFIFRRKLTESNLKLLPQECFVVDDNIESILALGEFSRFKPVWINRKTDRADGKYFTIFNLENFENILKNYPA